MLGTPVLSPARSNKVLMVKIFQTQCAGHPLRWLMGVCNPPASIPRRKLLLVDRIPYSRA
jgi:hypothetical protein